MATFQKILERNRRRFFIGRGRELAEAELLLTPDDGSRVLFFVAPGGFGKSTLLQEIEARAQATGHAVARIDCRHHRPTPGDIAKALDGSLADLEGEDGVRLLILDTFEHLKNVETWFYRNLLPGLPSSLRIIIAGRGQPAPRWSTDPAWIGMMRILELDNFDRQETNTYLSLRKLDESLWTRAWRISQGNPLLLAVVADVYGRLGADVVRRHAKPKQLQSLMLELVREGHTPSQRHALEAASIVRTLSKPLLAAMLPDEDVDALYEWLGGASFMSAAERGLFPHDLMREGVFGEMLRCDPEGLERLVQRAESFYAQRLVPEAVIPVDETLADITFLSRHGKSPAQLVELREADSLYADVPLDGDVEMASSLVCKFQGAEQQRLFDISYVRQPEGFVAIRNANGEMAGFVQFVEFASLSDEETRDDRIIDSCRRFVRKRGLNPGRRASLARFWLDRCRHIALSSVQAFVMVLVMGQAAAVADLDFSGMVQEDDQISRTMAALAGHDIVPGSEMVLGGTQVFVTLHDWGEESVADWMVRTNRQMRGISAAPPAPALDGKEFKEAVKHALRNFTRADRLSGNPLLNSSLSAAPENDRSAKVEALRNSILAASESLRTSPRNARYDDILHHTYFRPAVGRLAAAEALNMAPSTYYRHLAVAVDLLTEILKRQSLIA